MYLVESQDRMGDGSMLSSGHIQVNMSFSSPPGLQWVDVLKFILAAQKGKNEQKCSTVKHEFLSTGLKNEWSVLSMAFGGLYACGIAFI